MVKSDQAATYTLCGLWSNVAGEKHNNTGGTNVSINGYMDCMENIGNNFKLAFGILKSHSKL